MKMASRLAVINMDLLSGELSGYESLAYKVNKLLKMRREASLEQNTNFNVFLKTIL